LLVQFLGETLGEKFVGHPWNYRGEIDAMTDRLCAWCKENDVTKCSLELQIWWRDHQAWDKRREEQERADSERVAIAAVARAKLDALLTPEEKRALNLHVEDWP
jgi:hypothetical protein